VDGKSSSDRLDVEGVAVSLVRRRGHAGRMPIDQSGPPTPAWVRPPTGVRASGGGWDARKRRDAEPAGRWLPCMTFTSGDAERMSTGDRLIRRS